MLKAWSSFRQLMALWPQVLKSKTLIVNAATIVLAVATTLTNLEVVQQWPEVVAFLSATLIPGINIVLRFFTDKSISSKKNLWG